MLVDDSQTYWKSTTRDKEKYNNIRRHIILQNDNMEQRPKRSKHSKELIVTDFASSIDGICKNMKSIQGSYNEILKANKAVVTYLQNKKEFENTSSDKTMSDDLSKSTA